jgi:hypothetical protein
MPALRRDVELKGLDGAHSCYAVNLAETYGQ